MIGVRLDALDTLFFRDGTPFSADSTPQEDVGGRFPPHPPTVVGALRAALARCNGWGKGARWPDHLAAVLGDGPSDLGRLQFEGPFVLRNNVPLFPVPWHVLGKIEKERWVPRVLLRPGNLVTCDLGDAVRLPEAPTGFVSIELCRPGGGWWLTPKGMQSVLRGAVPHTYEVVSSPQLFGEETRIGLERDRTRRTAEKGRLYSSRHVRLNRGASLGMRIGGIPSEWTLPTGRIVPLGGESRVVSCRVWDRPLDFAVPQADIENSGHVAVVALTPLDLDEGTAMGRRPLDMPGGIRVISVCCDRPQRIGGWDSFARGPLPLRSVLPPGSVLFCHAAEPKSLIAAAEASDGLLRLGSRQAWGFGSVSLGIWPSQSEENS